MAPGMLREFGDDNQTVWGGGGGVENNLQLCLLHETLGCLQQTRQEAVCVFNLMAVEVSGQSSVQDLVTESAASHPSVTVWHQ